MFDTINGLPLHPLAVHGVVVLLPLAAVVTTVVAARPALQRYTPWVIAFDTLTMLMTFVAKEAGEKLEHRVEQIGAPAGLEDHAEWGDKVFALSVALFIGSIVMHYVKSKSGAMKWVAILAGLGTVLLIVVVVITGDTGASLVWKDVIANTGG